MKNTSTKLNKRTARHKRIRARVVGTSEKPRLAVFKSNQGIYAQVIDDSAGKTLAAGDTRKLSGKTMTEKATSLGKDIAEKAKKAGVETIVFDRGGFRYQGAIAAMADAARESGLKF